MWCATDGISSTVERRQAGRTSLADGIAALPPWLPPLQDYGGMRQYVQWAYEARGQQVCLQAWYLSLCTFCARMLPQVRLLLFSLRTASHHSQACCA